jgi:hypothetical protein
MKPNFALNLSHEGIMLLHRAPRGNWTEVGEVALDDPEFRETLAFLRSTAVSLEGKGFGTKLILPDTQILYRDVTAPGPGETERQAQILNALEGETPYDVADLSFDWRDMGDFVRVAVVANETLDEAEEFAVEHRFNPLSFVGRENDEADAWQPFFGRTDYSFAFLGEDVDVRDTPIPTAAPTAEPAPDSLFSAQSEPTDSEEPPQAVEPEDTESDNMFSAADEETAVGNIFAGDEPPQISEPDEAAPQTPTTEDIPPDEANPTEAPMAEDVPTLAPTFASRRSDTDGAGEEAPADEPGPLARIAPRIALPLDVPGEADGISADEAGASSEPVAEDTLRASLLEVPPKPSLKDQIAPLLARLPDIAVYGRKAAGALAVVLAVAGGRLGAKISALRPAKKTDPTIAGAEPAGHEPQEPQEPGVFPPLTGPDETNASPQQQRKRKVVLTTAAIVALLGFVGLAYAFLAPGNQNDDVSGAALNATAPERGVRANNRPGARPSDFSEIVASTTATQGQGQSTLRPTRPERRSVFEGGVDPDAELPDTAQPVTDLTAEELADIRAAGLPTPTPEELAESGETPDDGQMSAEEIATTYAATGALQAIRNLRVPNPDHDRDDIFVATIDRALEANDATILPDFNNGVADAPPGKKLSPVGPDVVFDLDERGLVRPTTAGTMNPEGILVRLGKPVVTPPKRPRTEELVPPDPRAALKPQPRPAGLKTGEDAIFVQGRMTLAQLRGFRAKSRPISEQMELNPGDTAPSELAVLTSLQPSKRPGDFDKTVENTRTKLAAAAAAAAPAANRRTARVVAPGPRIPTRANVAKIATIKNAINLNRLNLIGVYGSPSKRSALLRLPSGRYVKVKLGDRIDGGRVAAIGDGSLSYAKQGRNRVLKVPN